MRATGAATRMSERRMQAMQKQTELLQFLVTEGSTPSRMARVCDSVKPTPLAETDNIEAYLTTFE